MQSRPVTAAEKPIGDVNLTMDVKNGAGAAAELPPTMLAKGVAPGTHAIPSHKALPTTGVKRPFAPPCHPVSTLMSMQQQASSQRDTQITPPSMLFSSHGAGAPSSDKDEYLLRLLNGGRAMPIPVSAIPNRPNSFRAPDPVPQRAAQTAQAAKPFEQKQPISAAPATGSQQDNKAAAQTAQVTETNAQTAAVPQPSDVSFTYAETQQRMGSEAAATLRNAVVGHQVMFIEQIYDLHRALAVQKLLVRNCPEVQQVVVEATKLMQADSGMADPPTKRARHGGRLPPGTLRPESQFAAVPLPGDTVTATGDGSGDDGDGSGGNGSGGGSTSPQPQHRILLPPRTLPHLPTAAAPSGASAAPMAAMPGFVARPMVPMPPSPWAGGMGQMGAYAGMMGPTSAGGPYNMMMGDPMAWWYQNFYGQRQGMQAAPQAGLPATQPPAVPGANPMNPMAPPPADPAARAAAKWWQDANRTFGPPGDPEAVARQMANEDPRQEVESAPPSDQRNKPKGSSQMRSRYSDEPKEVVAVPVTTRRRVRRKPADPIDEASSGTTGLGAAHLTQDTATDCQVSPKHRQGPHADANVAALLLSIGKSNNHNKNMKVHGKE